MLLLLVFSLAFSLGVLSGLFGIGGGILMTPALLYLPLWLGLGALDMKEVSGLTITHALFSCLSGVRGRARKREMDRKLVIWMGGSLFLSGLLGAVLSHWTDPLLLKLMFAGMAALAAFLMFLPSLEPETGDPIVHLVPRAVILALGVGLSCGLVGQGGSFLLIPIMTHSLKLPIRVAIGTNLGLVLLASIAGFAGKLAAGQILLLPSIAVMLGAFPGAHLGSRWSENVRSSRLRPALGAVIAFCAVVILVEAIALAQQD